MQYINFLITPILVFIILLLNGCNEKPAPIVYFHGDVVGFWRLQSVNCSNGPVIIQGLNEEITFDSNRSGKLIDSNDVCSVSQNFQYKVMKDKMFLAPTLFDCNCDVTFTKDFQPITYSCPSDYPLIEIGFHELKKPSKDLLILTNGSCQFEYHRF